MSDLRLRVRRGVALRNGTGDREAVLLAGLAGLAAGFLAGRWLARADDPVARGELGDPDDSWADRWGERMDAAVEAGARGLRDLRRRWAGVPPADLVRAGRLLAAIPDADRVRVHDLGDGIVELVGEAPPPAERAAVEAVQALPGVRIVVNRIWSRRDAPAN